MARNSRLSVCLEIVMRNSSQSHWIRSTKRQRTTPWIAGIGPSSTRATRAARCASVSLDGWPGGLRLTRACLQRVAAWGGRAHVGAMRRLDVTDEQWRRLEPLLPPEKPRTGRPNHDHRRVVSGMLWIHRTGAPWRDLPERYGPVGTVSSRFYRWCRAGVWDRILLALQAEADARGEIDWDLHFVDATIIRAHQHADGARRTGAVGG